MKISIENFLRTGNFGSVEIGMNKSQVLSLLGSAGSDTDLGDNGSILLYAWYEFFFNHEGVLFSIQNDNYNPRDVSSYYFKNEVFEIVPWLLDDGDCKSIEVVKRLLETASLEYKEIDYYGRVALRLSSGIIVDFGDEQGEGFQNMLLGIRFWPE